VVSVGVAMAAPMRLLGFLWHFVVRVPDVPLCLRGRVAAGTRAGRTAFVERGDCPTHHKMPEEV
jgi:hypothetical protein